MYENVLRGFTPLPTVTPAALSFREALKDYEIRGSLSEKLLIYPELLTDPHITKKIRETPVAYHILYFNADQGLRAIHLVVETRSHVKEYSSQAIKVGMSNKNFNYISYDMVTDFIGQLSAERLAGALREIEGILLNDKGCSLSTPLFSGRQDALYQYHILLYKLKELRKE